MSPYLQRSTHESLKLTIKEAGFNVLPFQNQIPSLGQWSWLIGYRGDNHAINDMENAKIKVETKWLNAEAIKMMFSFGKSTYFPSDSIQVNYMDRPLTGYGF